MKVVFCWTHISGYMAACWRELAKQPGIDLHVIAWSTGSPGAQSPFHHQVMDGVPHTLLAQEQQNDASLLTGLVIGQQPQILVLSGWVHGPYRELVHLPELNRSAFIMTMDTPWSNTWRQHLAPWAMASYFKNIDAVVVAGERAWQYARRLGFDEKQIMRGTYGINYHHFAVAHQLRCAKPSWPKSFLFVGRYMKSKALDVLVPGYQVYRQRVSDPWPLHCAGAGPDQKLLQGVDGIVDHGFVQPAEQQHLFAQAGAFVLASRYDPWPLVILESCAAGLPILCTEACGSAVENVRSYYNGLTFATDHPESLAKTLNWAHEHYDQLPVMGQRSMVMVEPFAAEHWAKRWNHILSSFV